MNFLILTYLSKGFFDRWHSRVFFLSFHYKPINKLHLLDVAYTSQRTKR